MAQATITVNVQAAPMFTCPKCGATFGTQEELDAHIALVHPTVAEWTPEQMAKFIQMGLTTAEIAQIPADTTDIIRILAARPKIAIWVGIDELKRNAKSEAERVIAEHGETGVVTNVFVKATGSNWWDWCDNYYVYICVRSPLATIVVLAVALALVALFAWCFVSYTHLEIQRLKTETHADYTDTVQSLNDLYEKGLLTYDQWQAALGNVQDAHDKAQETGTSWVDQIMGMLPILLPVILVLAIISMVPRGRRD